MEILQQVAEFTKELLAGTPLDALLDHLLAAAINFSQASLGFWILKKENQTKPLPGFEVVSLKKVSKERLENREFLSRFINVQGVLKSGERLINWAPLKKGIREITEGPPLSEPTSYVVLPLKNSGRPFGALYLEDLPVPEDSQREDLGSLEILVDQAALAWQRARMFEELKKVSQQLSQIKKALGGELFSPEVPGEAAKEIFETPSGKISRKPKVLSEEKRLLLQALYDAGFHKGHAAKALGISRRYLYTQLQRHTVPVNRIEMKAYIDAYLRKS